MTQVNQAAVVQGGAPSAQGNQDGGLPISCTFSLYEMMEAIVKLELRVQWNAAKLQQNWATVLGGKAGLYAQLYNAGVAIGQDEAKSLRADAASKLLQGGIALGAMAVTGGLWAATTRPAINTAEAGIKEMSTMTSHIDESLAGHELGQVADVKVDPEATAQLQGWSNHSERIENYSAKDEIGVVNEEKADLNRRATAHAAEHQDLVPKIKERINETRQGYEAQSNNATMKFQYRTGFLSTASTAVSNMAASSYSGVQADAAEQKGKDTGANAVISQVEQAVAAQESRAQQTSGDAQQEAGRWAIAFAQASASQVHA